MCVVWMWRMMFSRLDLQSGLFFRPINRFFCCHKSTTKVYRMLTCCCAYVCVCACAASADAGATDADDDDTTSGNSDIHLHNNILKHFGAAGGKMMRKQGRKSKSRGRASMAMFAAPKGEENLEAKLGELSDVSLSEEKSTPKVTRVDCFVYSCR